MALLNKASHLMMGPPPYSHNQLYYNSASQASSSGPRPVASPHIYMGTPQGRFPFLHSPMTPAFFIAQYGSRPRVAMPQQCPVPAGSPGLFPDSGPYDGMDVSPPPKKAAPPPQLAPEIPADPTPLLDPIPTNKKVEGEAAATLETPLPTSSTSNGVAQQVVVQPEPESALAPEPQPPVGSPPAQEEAELTWKDKDDQLDAENIQPDCPQPTTPEENQYNEEQRDIIIKEKKKYERDFLLKLQFISASLIIPQGLPVISGVILDKANTSPLCTLEPRRKPEITRGPDFTPAFAYLEHPSMGGGSRGPMQRMEPRKIISLSLIDHVQLNKAEKAWKPSANKSVCNSQPKELEERDSEQTKDLFKQFCSILNKLTPQKFERLMTQVKILTIDTDERLKGVIDLTFEKAISEPPFSEIYAKMCRVLIGLKVQSKENPGCQADFRKMLLNRCQKEFEKDKDSNEIFDKKQKELEAASGEEEKQRLREELKVAKDKARRRSLGNIKFIGELFKLKMLAEVVMHDCIIKLLKNSDDESLEILCKLLSTIGKDLDVKKEKGRVDQCFHQMEKIVKERKTSSRIRFMMQDVLDLRTNNWVPRRGFQGPKTIDQIREQANMEEQMEVQETFNFKKETGSGPGGRMGGGGRSGRKAPLQDEGWNTEPIRENPPIDSSGVSQIFEVKRGMEPLDPSRLMKIIRNPFPYFDTSPEGKDMWGKGCSGGSSYSGTNSGNRPSTSTLNTSSALQQLSRPSTHTDRRVPQRSSFSGEEEEWVQDRKQCHPGVSSITEDREKGETAATLPQPTTKRALSEEQVKKKAKAILEEYLSTNNMKEAGECVEELDSTQLLFGFVHQGLDMTLDHSTIHRKNMGSLFHHLIKTGSLPAQQYYKGLQEILEEAEDMAIDIPHMWLYLAELITPMLHEGGVPLGELLIVISKHLVPLSRVGDLVAHILTLLCKEKGQKEAGTMWREAGLQWKDFLLEDVDVNKFVTEKSLLLVTEKNKEQESFAELRKHLDKLLIGNTDTVGHN